MKNQKGISLLFVFFVMTIILSMVLGLGSILLSESKIIQSSEDSLIAFYAADTGMEKTLYYSRKNIPSEPEGVTSGVCNMGNACLDCQDFQLFGSDNGCNFCRNCRVEYTTDFGNSEKNHQFKTSAFIYPNGNFYILDISVNGFYGNTGRAIGLQIANKDLSSSAPKIKDEQASREGSAIEISANIKAKGSNNIDPQTVKAHVRDSHDFKKSDVDTILLSLPESGSGDIYSGLWPDPGGYYMFYVEACDTEGNCAQTNLFTVPN